MDSPYLDPRFLLTLIVALISLVGWLAKLEFRNSESARAIAAIKEDVSDIRRDLEAHRLNQDMHFNPRISAQVDKANEQRFTTIEQALIQINAKLDRMAERK